MSGASSAPLTPSARILAEAAATFSITDARGRRLTVKRVTALDKLRLFKAVGAHLAHNAPYFGMAVIAASVLDIDGIPVPLPASEAALEAAVAQLGNDGIDAIAGALKQRSDADAGRMEGLAGN